MNSHQSGVTVQEITNTEVADPKMLTGQGWTTPTQLLSEIPCQQYREQLLNLLPAPLDWKRGQAVSSRQIFEIASNPKLLKVLNEVLGKDVILWGAELLSWVTASHDWVPDGVVSPSSDPLVSAIVSLGDCDLEVGAGEKQGHQAHNSCDFVLRSGFVTFLMTRMLQKLQPAVCGDQPLCLLLHYSSARTPIRIPSSVDRQCPIGYETVPQPPCILISGNSRKSQNRIVPPPCKLGIKKPQLTVRFRQLELPLPEDPVAGRKSYPMFRGSTSGLDYLGCYVSVLSHGHLPHPPHIHEAEEILMVLGGTARIITCDAKESSNQSSQLLRRGQIVYYPSSQYHTIVSEGSAPATYLMFKWRGLITSNKSAASTQLIDYTLYHEQATSAPHKKWVLFDSSTQQLRRLQVHLSALQPASGYLAHVDAYDVAIFVLKGNLDAGDHLLTENAVAFYSSGYPHGLKNVGENIAWYLVFEFHPNYGIKSEGHAQA